MPPYVPRKRLRSSSPVSSPKKKTPPKRKAKGESSKAITAPPRKPTLFDDLDATSSPHHNGGKTREIQDSEDDDDSPLSSLSDADFEDVLPASKRQKTIQQLADDDDDEEEDEDIEFEDVDPVTPIVPQTFVPADLHGHISNDLELTLVRDTRISLTNDALLGKKGPSKLERQIRVSTHCVHVLLLMWHNALRNAWICDPTVQGIMLSHLPPRLWDEVDRWRKGSGLELHPEPAKEKPAANTKGKGKKAATTAASSTSNVKTRKGKGKEKEQDRTESLFREGRDWGSAAQRLENGAIDRSQGDPLYRLMKALSAWWKQRFRITAPGLRKQGYMSLERLDRLTKGFNEAQKDDSNNMPERFGERIRNLDEFRHSAQECAGSRDVGEQLFTALLRGLGMEARMVASLQPLGFGWNKLEEADPEKEDTATRTWTGETSKPVSTVKSSTSATTKKTSSSGSSSRRTTARTSKATSLNETTDSDLQIPDSDDESVINLSSSDDDQPLTTPKKSNQSSKAYDKDLPYPVYWTEVFSPVQTRYIPVEPLITSLIGTNPEITVQSLEPRGAKADKAKQGVSYILAYSPDGTAKDVTVRYLKGKVLPGRTKGNRLPAEKIPVYNKHGKIKRYELRDWFKDRAMRPYSRGFHPKYPVTEIHNLEDGSDLKPAQMVKKEVKEGEETLQFYKTSKEFVLERHLKREEALVPGAEVVRFFNPKAKKGKGDVDGGGGKGEPVYLRKDVVVVKSAETWHKQGRAPKEGEQPLKRVPYRAATTNRRREIAEAELATGGKVLQGLYSMEQTDWIIPDPIVDGVIPKNEYGNIDLFAEHMCPAGAVHVPYRGAVRVCKRLGVDFAEAVVDFEFGHRMAVPVIQGVVVAEEHFDRVMEELRKDEEERKRKEDEKRRAEVMKMWRKMLMGLRIVERLRGVYGDVNDQKDVGVVGDSSNSGGGGFVVEDDDGGGGGFIPEGYELEEEEEEGEKTMAMTSGFFPTTVLSDEDDDGEDDTLMIENGDLYMTGGRAQMEDTEPEEPDPESEPESEPEPAPAKKGKGKGKSAMSTRPTRQSAATMKEKKKKNSTKAAMGGLRRRRKQVASSSDEDEYEVGDSQDDDDDDDDDGDIYMDSS